DVRPAADIYALGAILYAMLTGRPPFQGASAMETVLQVIHDEPVPPRRLRPTVPRDLQTICLKCLLKDPHRRYATAEELAEDLRPFQAQEPIQARPVSLARKTWRRMARHPWVVSLSLVVVLALALVGYAFGVLADSHLRNTLTREIDTGLNDPELSA